MTVKEAIENLKAILEEATETEDAVSYVTSVDAESLNLAISALEKQDVPDTNVGDMISRQAAISIPLTPKGLRKYQTCNLDDAYNEGWGDYQACVSQLPSVHPEYEPVKAEDFANNVREYALQFYGMA